VALRGIFRKQFDQVCDCGVECARGGYGDEWAVCGWVSRRSLVSWDELWEVACVGVREVK